MSDVRGSEGTYDSWEALVAAEASGWVVVGIISDGKQTWPWVIGTFADRQDANNARVRSRNKFKREKDRHDLSPEATAKWFVRPCWKTDAL